MEKKEEKKAFFSAACIMGITAIGPGFLVQTAQFTSDLKSACGAAIMVSAFLAVICQLNIWRVICVSGERAQDLANKVAPGLGYVLSALVVLGGLAFNIGNVGGGALGLSVLTGISTETCTLIVGGFAITVYLMKNADKVIDRLAKTLCAVMVLVIVMMIFITEPPAGEALKNTFLPYTGPAPLIPAVLTLLGATVGGYVTFSGAHRLVDKGIKGQEHLREIEKSAVTGIAITTVVRILLFLAVLGVVKNGIVLDPENPAADAFAMGAGKTGYIFAGIVMLSASMTPITSAAYTSVSFIKTFHPFLEKQEKKLIILFIAFSAVIMYAVGKPAALLILASSLNGLILPVVLGICLVAAGKEKIMGKGYRHPVFLTVAGGLTAAVLLVLGVSALGTQLTLL